MNEIQLGKETKQVVLQDTIRILKPILLELKEKELVIGNQIDQIIKQTKLEKKIIGTCPKCTNGKLVILRSKKTGKRFVGCTNYFYTRCDVTYPLPQIGTIKKLSKPCKICGCPILSIAVKNKPPWKFCLDPNCSSKGA